MLRAALTHVVEIWQKHRVSRVAAALSYYSIFTVAPLTFVVVAITHSLFGRRNELNTIEGELQPVLGNSGAHGIDVLVRSSAHQISTTPIVISGALVLIAILAIFMQLQEALDDVWDIPEAKRGGFRQVVALRLHVILVVAALALLAVIALIVAITAGRAAAFGVNVLALAAFLTIAYWALPNARVGWRSCVTGALVTCAILVCGELLLGLYFSHFHPETAYGEAGSLIVLLIWIYYSVQLFMFGAVLTRALERFS